MEVIKPFSHFSDPTKEKKLGHIMTYPPHDYGSFKVVVFVGMLTSV